MRTAANDKLLGIANITKYRRLIQMDCGRGGGGGGGVGVGGYYK